MTLSVHEAVVDWISDLPCILKDPAEGAAVLCYSTAWMKTTLLFLNLKFDFQMDLHLQNHE